MPKRIDFFDGSESSTTPTIGNIDTTSLLQYPDDAAYEAANIGSPNAGNIYFNTTVNLIRYYNGTAWINIVDETSTQTLQNKTIDGTSVTGTNTVLTDAEDVSFDNTVSGLVATDVQAAIDEVEGRIDDVEVDVSNLLTDVSDLVVLSGLSANSTDNGTFTGTIIPDSSTTKAALQALETSVETKLDSSLKGAANGLAELDGGGKVPSTQLPSYVDDVEEFANFASLPVTGEAGKIYITIDDNKTYRWSGAIYVEIASSGVSSVNGDAGPMVVLDTDDIAEGATNFYHTDVRARTAVVDDAITDAITDKAPSQNAVFDALATKQAAGNYITALTGDVTAAGPGSSTATIATAAVGNSKLADMSANTIKVRNAGSSGVPSDAAISDFTDEPTPAAGDVLIGFLATGELRKFDIGNLPGGGGGAGYEAFTANDTWVVPSGVTSVIMTLVGGGGGGAAAGATNTTVGGAGGGGGGAGQIVTGMPVEVTPGDTLTITIGAAGAGGTPAANSRGGNGGTGGATSVTGTGVSVSAFGGGAGGGGGGVVSGGSTFGNAGGSTVFASGGAGASNNNRPGGGGGGAGWGGGGAGGVGSPGGGFSGAIGGSSAFGGGGGGGSGGGVSGTYDGGQSGLSNFSTTRATRGTSSGNSGGAGGMGGNGLGLGGSGGNGSTGTSNTGGGAATGIGAGGGGGGGAYNGGTGGTGGVGAAGIVTIQY